MTYPETPDGRYFVAKGRLWRKTDPALDEETRQKWVDVLMSARRAIAQTEEGSDARRNARNRVDKAKRALGERGPVWWEDDAPDQTYMAPGNSTYADWWSSLPEAIRQAGLD